MEKQKSDTQKEESMKNTSTPSTSSKNEDMIFIYWDDWRGDNR
jgi:hypothetical protein